MIYTDDPMTPAPKWLSELEAKARAAMLYPPEFEDWRKNQFAFDLVSHPAQVLALCKLVRELGEQLRIEISSNRGDIWLELAVGSYERGPVVEEDSE